MVAIQYEDLPFRRRGTVLADIATTVRKDRNADTTDLKRELAAARLAEKITAIVDAAPPLDDAQRAALAALLRKDR